MTQVQFKELQELQSKIEDKKRKLSRIDRLVKTCGVECKISGAPINSFNTRIEYEFSDSELTNKILKSEKEKVSKKLKELEERFEKY